MELSAAIAGFNTLRPGALVTMIGDSQYVIKAFTEWLPGWKAKGWEASNKKPVLNVEPWQALELAVARHLSVTWQWVRGHRCHRRQRSSSPSDRPSWAFRP
ncbi:ribonuclease HI [Methylorubrum rhodinum]|uniref:Ribonuclease HI n=2 Tax=Methylorubrum rhodinum TaxID=29428 RepID=A0A840ZKV0_9HYPH|nr:ribonuclease HI [Methylorubrum rhodinum]